MIEKKKQVGDEAKSASAKMRMTAKMYENAKT